MKKKQILMTTLKETALKNVDVLFSKDLKFETTFNKVHAFENKSAQHAWYKEDAHFTAIYWSPLL